MLRQINASGRLLYGPFIRVITISGFTTLVQYKEPSVVQEALTPVFIRGSFNIHGKVGKDFATG